MLLVVNLVAVLFGVAGLLVASRGTNRLHSILSRTPRTDYVIASLAWIDRLVFKAGQPVPGHTAKREKL